MAKNYYLTTTDCTYGPTGDDFHKELSTTQPSTSALSVGQSKTSTENNYGCSVSGEPNSTNWNGTYTAYLDVATAAGDAAVTCDIYLCRYNAAGSLQETKQSTTGPLAVDSTGVKTFNFGSLSWSSPSATDRLVMRFVCYNGTSKTVNWGINAGTTYVNTPFSSTVPLAVAVAGQSGVAATVVRKQPLAVTVAGQSGVAGIVVRGQRLSVAVAGQSGVAAALIGLVSLAVAVAGQSDLAATLTVQQAYVGLALSVQAQAGVAATLHNVRPLAVAVAGQSGVAAALTVTSAQASLVFTGFETGDLTSELYELSGTVSIATTPVYTGKYAARVHPTGSGTGYFGFQAYSSAGRPTTLGSESDVWVKMHLRVATAPASADENILVFYNSAFSVTKARIRLTAARKLAVYNTSGTLVATGSSALTLDTWYAIEVRVGTGSSAPYEVRLNGNVELSGTFNAAVVGTQYVRFGKVGNVANNTLDLYYDDIIVSADGFLGWRLRVKHLEPARNGYYTGWTPSTGGKFECVDETPQNGTTDLISTTGDTAYTAKTWPCWFEQIKGSIKAVCACGWANSYTHSKSGKLRLRVGSTDSDTVSAAWNTSTAYWFYAKVHTTNPDTGQPWTVAGVNGVEVGVVTTGGSGYAYCTKLTLMVLYEEPVSNLPIPHRRELWKPDVQEAEIDWEHPLARGLIGCWIFNEGAGATARDLSPNQIHGTIYNSTWDGGIYGSTLDSHLSSGYVSLGSPTVLDDRHSKGGMSIVSAFRARSLGGNDTGMIYAKEAGLPNTSNGRLVFTVYPAYTLYFGKSCSTTVLYRRTTLSSFSLNKEYIAAVTWDGSMNQSGVHIYENGKESGYAEGSDGAGSFVSDASLTATINSLYDSREFDGPIHFTYIYDRPITAEEVRTLYADPFCFLRPRRVTISIPTQEGEVTPVLVQVPVSKPRWKPDVQEAEIDWEHPLARGLRACYLLNEGAGTLSRNLALAGPGGMSFYGSAAWKGCVLGHAVECGTNNYLEAAPVAGATNFTIYAVGQGEGAVSVQGNASDTQNWALRINSAGSSGFASSAGWKTVASPTFTGPGHAALTYDGAHLRSWNNGQLKDNTDTTSTPYTSPGTTQVHDLGKYAGFSQWLAAKDGYAPQVWLAYVWVRGLTQEELLQLYADPFCFLKPRRVTIVVSQLPPSEGGLQQLAASISGQASLAASLQRGRQLAAAIAAQSGLTAVLNALRPLAVAVAGQSAVWASLQVGGEINLTLEVAGQSNLAAEPLRTRYISGAVAGQSAVAATVVRGQRLAVAVAGQSAVWASLQVGNEVNLSVAVAGQSSLTALLKRNYTLTLAVSGQSSLTATAVRGQRLALVVTGQSSLAAALTVEGAVSLALGVSAQSGLTATLLRSPHLAVAVTGQSGVTALTHVTRPLALAVAGQAGFTAALTVGGQIELALAVAGQSGLTADYVRGRTLELTVSSQAAVTGSLHTVRVLVCGIQAYSNVAAQWAVAYKLALAVSGLSHFTAVWKPSYTSGVLDVWEVPYRDSVWNLPVRTRTWRVPWRDDTWLAQF